MATGKTNPRWNRKNLKIGFPQGVGSELEKENQQA
jgi:hypothetical protein